jgi:NAD(P)-dependent dehydrogenase (short-subunit alcohol dehydrogenase family)
MESTPPVLEGRVAIVTGGSRGIGFAIADAILARGGRVVITGLSQDRLDQAHARLGAGSRVEAVRADVRQADEAARMVDVAVARFGGLDILVNNAGVGRFVHAADMSIAQWHDVIDTNLSGVFYCCHAAIPHLRKRGGGWIINVSSLAGKNAFAGGAAYCASKAGLNAFSEALMQEVRYDGIRVSYVMPGSVATEFGGTPGGESWKLTSEDVAQVVVDLLAHDSRSLPSRVEIRPSQPPRK